MRWLMLRLDRFVGPISRLLTRSLLAPPVSQLLRRPVQFQLEIPLLLPGARRSAATRATLAPCPRRELASVPFCGGLLRSGSSSDKYCFGPSRSFHTQPLIGASALPLFTGPISGRTACRLESWSHGLPTSGARSSPCPSCCMSATRTFGGPSPQGCLPRTRRPALEVLPHASFLRLWLVRFGLGPMRRALPRPSDPIILTKRRCPWTATSRMCSLRQLGESQPPKAA